MDVKIRIILVRGMLAIVAWASVGALSHAASGSTVSSSAANGSPANGSPANGSPATGGAARSGVTAWSAAKSSSGTGSATGEASHVKASHVLGPDDVIEVQVTIQRQFSKTLTIRPDGKIDFPEVGEIQAAGKTATALAAEIRTKLSQSYNNVEVTVAIVEIRSRRVRILGAVKAPGIYQLRPDGRFTDIVVGAEGLSTKPSRVAGRIIRAGTVLPLNVEQAVLRPESRANLLLKPDDLIVLDERNIKQVNVIGKVEKPGAYDLEEGVTVMSLVMQAGPTERAALRKAYVVRAGTEIPLNLYPLLVEGKTEDRAAKFKFQAGDVLNIPENEAQYGVTGQVTKPGLYALPEKPGGTTLLKALEAAEGPLPNADLRNASITRLVDREPTTIPIDLESRRNGQSPDDIALQPGDVLHIPPIRNQLHVIGKVGKPGTYDITEGMSLMSLMSEVGGNAENGAGLSKAYIIRNGAQIPVDLYPLFSGGKLDPNLTNFHFQNGDILVVPDVQNQINVIGQVEKPGPYDLSDNLSVISLVTQASPTKEAALKKAYVVRGGAEIPLDLHAILVDARAEAVVNGFKFQSGDVLVIPENPLRYSVMGRVAKPGYYTFPEKKGEATVLEALSEAGGPVQDGNLSNAGIIRAVNGEPTVIPLNLEFSLNDLKKGNLDSNIQLQPEDILYIPPKKRGFKWTDVLNPLVTLRTLGVGF
jgi:protein involved in polysaccharide export with SLBB domain